MEDGQEAKELPQGGSLRDNVDTSVTLKRTLSRLSAARPDETDSVRSVLDARIQPPPISRNREENAHTHTLSRQACPCSSANVRGNIQPKKRKAAKSAVTRGEM